MLSYAICVCNEARELGNLLAFLEEVRDRSNTEIVILIDSSKTTKDVAKCLKEYPECKVFYRDFDWDFAEHKNYLNSKCKGDYIFNLDADEIPQETLVKAAEAFKGEVELVMIPRINICPGYTEKFAQRWNFNINNAGWINWPDYQGRLYINSPDVKWVGKVHEKIQCKTSGAMSQEPNPALAIWHIKDIKRQNAQNESYQAVPLLTTA